jgi:hypothetical protein
MLELQFAFTIRPVEIMNTIAAELEERINLLTYQCNTPTQDIDSLTLDPACTVAVLEVMRRALQHWIRG